MSKKKRKRERSTSEDSEVDRKKMKKKSPKKKKKDRKKKRHRSPSTSSVEITSASSSSTSLSSSSSKDRKLKEKKKKKKKDKKRKKSVDPKKSRHTEEPEMVGPSVPADLPISEPERPKMAPMTKEEWDKRQSVVRKVYDESTGRYRLIKGDGEVLEEIVSRDRHKEINKLATEGDGKYFQSKLPQR